MTEEEARMNWCPLARGTGGDGNRVAFGDDGEASDLDRRQYAAEMACLYPCLASDCMAWRWRDPLTETRATRVADNGEPGPQPPGDNWRMIDADDEGATTWGRDKPNRRGYCGLAGDPAR